MWKKNNFNLKINVLAFELSGMMVNFHGLYKIKKEG